MKVALAISLVLMASLQARGQILVSTTFDAGRQDWFDTFGSATGSGALWQSGGGNPGGFIRATDRTDASNTIWYFENNSTFNGDRSSAYQGSLQYDIVRLVNGTALTLNSSNADVLLSGAGMQFMHVGTVPTTSWSTMTVPLMPSSWTKVSGGVNSGVNPTQTEFLALLSNVTNLRIRGNYNIEVNDSTGLDNVMLVAPVPEPTAILLVGLFVGWVGCRRQRPRRLG